MNKKYRYATLIPSSLYLKTMIAVLKRLRILSRPQHKKLKQNFQVFFAPGRGAILNGLHKTSSERGIGLRTNPV